jgi:hypothetical protein
MHRRFKTASTSSTTRPTPGPDDDELAPVARAIEGKQVGAVEKSVAGAKGVDAHLAAEGRPHPGK